MIGGGSGGGGGAQLDAVHDQHATCFVWGDYNHGILETGTVTTPWVINSDHDLRVTAGKHTKWIDNYGDGDDYDFGSENIQIVREGRARRRRRGQPGRSARHRVNHVLLVGERSTLDLDR